MLAVLAAFIIMLFNVAEAQREQTRLLSSAVSSKAGVDELANAANYVFLSGEGSVIRKEFFVGNGSLCLYNELDATGVNRLYCTVPGAPIKQTGGLTRVRSIPLYSPPDVPVDYSGGPCAPENIPSNQGKLLGTGWYLFKIEFVGGAQPVKLTCEKKLS